MTTSNDDDRLRACIQAMRDCEGDTQRYSEADVAFHVTVAEISGNPLLRSFNAVITVALRGLMNQTARGVKAAEKNHAGTTGRHEKLVKAIEKRDEIAAAQAMLKVIAGGQRFAKYRAKLVPKAR